MFTIDKGKKDGIKPGMNVMAGSGLVGIVTETGPNWASVRSIIDDTSYVSGMMLSTGEKCMNRGDLRLIGSGKIRFEDLPVSDAEIEKGEQVVTSYISNKYLQGILIGYVSNIRKDPSELNKRAYLTPVVDFEHLEAVLIIKAVREKLEGFDE